ncbi:hypothetical protein L4X63_09485 [Geomonas sp. Red32]|uniref:hypothetical protein n=1 Tax=Geomonas sp. Red32 TaxID=2912856 RepID=UPI00202D09A6|nr:hypothetical protein [Geomonas sp. Red32]MCM0081766.1 hypothetical protein [Geomonas sp. Red32]MCM0081820.1 hypothetical protein [Geomonas sp. Red32]
MQRTETPDGQFVPGNTITGQKGSKVSTAWLMSVQEEICGVIEAAGIVLDPAERNQLLLAIATHATGAVYTDIGGSGATMKMGWRAEKAADGSISWSMEPVTLNRGNLDA